MTLYEKISTALKIDNTEIIARYNNGNKTEDYNIEYRKKDDYNYSKKYTINNY